MRLINSKLLEFKNKDKNLKIGYLSNLSNCTCGIYNTFYDKVSISNSTFGDFTYIGDETIIWNAKIGKFCSIGPNCKIGIGKHPAKDYVSTHPLFFSTLKQSQITFADKNYFIEYDNIEIGNDVWIGTNVIVVDGIKIGDGVIVAAGSVVTKNIPPYAIVGGVPAKIIRYRFEDYEITKLLEIKWWDMDIRWLKNNFKKLHNIDEFINNN